MMVDIVYFHGVKLRIRNASCYQGNRLIRLYVVSHEGKRIDSGLTIKRAKIIAKEFAKRNIK